MRGLDPRIHPSSKQSFRRGWIAGSSPAMTVELVAAAVSLLLVCKDDRATCREHAADAVAHRDLCTLHLRRRDPAHLAHALLQRVHAVHAGMHVAQATA